MSDRYTFDRDAAEAAIRAIEQAEDDAALAASHPDLARLLKGIVAPFPLDWFDPARDFEHNSTVDGLISLVWEAGWLTGPARPDYEHEETDEYCQWRADLGEHPACVRLVTGWRDVGQHVGELTPEGGEWRHQQGVEAALALLDAMVVELNAALTELDNYIAARVTREGDVPSPA